MINDEELMRRTAGGDLAAYNELVSRYQQTAWRLSSRFMGNTQDAQDVAQEAFIRIFQAAPRYRPTASFTTYLYRIVLRLCMDTARKKQPVAWENIEDAACPLPDAAQDIEQRRRDRDVRAAIQGLPKRQRRAIILKEYCELSYAEIARILSASIKSVERLLARARETIMKELKGYHE